MADGSGLVTPDDAENEPEPDPPPALDALDLRDRVVGMHAELDEIFARLDDLQARLDAYETMSETRRGFGTRARARLGRVRMTIVRRARRSQ